MENKTKPSNNEGNIDQNQLFKLLVVVAALFALLFVAYKLSMNSKKEQAANQTQLAQVEKTNVDFSELPERFPSNIPIETGAQITQNYNSKTPEGQFQATRVFITKQSLAANIKLYTDFLTKEGYEIKSSVDQPTLKMVMGSKGAQSIQVTVNENTVNKDKTVSISYIVQDSLLVK